MIGGKEEISDIPQRIKRFRSIVNGVKRSIIERTEEYSKTVDIQDKANLNGVQRRIHQFGMILNAILSGNENDMTNKIANHFKRNDFDFNTLSDEDRGLCEHYIKMDIFMYPYDLNLPHINSVSKTGDA